MPPVERLRAFGPSCDLPEPSSRWTSDWVVQQKIEWGICTSEYITKFTVNAGGGKIRYRNFVVEFQFSTKRVGKRRCRLRLSWPWVQRLRHGRFGGSVCLHFIRWRCETASTGLTQLPDFHKMLDFFSLSAVSLRCLCSASKSSMHCTGSIFPFHTCIRRWEAELYLRTNSQERRVKV